MNFTVKAISRDGSRTVFSREARSRDVLLRQLRAEGFAVVSAEASAEDGKDGKTGGGMPCDRPPWHPAWLKSPGKFEIEMTLRQLSSMVKSGVSLLTSLKTVAGQSFTPRMSKTWMETADAVTKGETFSSALEKNVSVFGEVTVRLAEAGEKSGELDRTLARAADQMEARRELKSAVANAIMYPAVAIAMSIGVSAYLVTGVIPKIAEFLSSGDVELPAVTQSLVDVSAWLTANAAALAGWIAAGAAAWFAAGRIRVCRELEHAFLLRIPATGGILRLSGTALFSRSMQIMTESGVTLVDALGTASRILRNERLSRRAADAREAVLRGEPLSTALENAKEFMPMLRAMVSTGETSGALAESFDETARFHESMLRLAVKRFGMVIEPVMVLVTGAIVGFVYVAFFTAMFAIAGAS